MDDERHEGTRRRPTPLMDRWRAECERALARADPAGRDDHLVAYVLGAYFQAVHDGLAMIADPQEQDLYGRQEAERFVAFLRRVPTQRQRVARETADALRRDGVFLLPDRTDDTEPGR